jgi:hypothetical protein
MSIIRYLNVTNIWAVFGRRQPKYLLESHYSNQVIKDYAWKKTGENHKFLMSCNVICMYIYKQSRITQHVNVKLSLYVA